MRDTRLVQTAVIGDEHSDVPVVLPTSAIQLDAFRKVHRGETFWGGVLLGGCGTQLSHKLYLDRQCHFQHKAQPSGLPHMCRRPRAGESSADHLYVKRELSQSLLDHGRRSGFEFPNPIGSLLDIDLEDGLALRVHMDGSVPPDWKGGRVPVLGPGVVLEPGVLSTCAYVYRVRCESVGASRRVLIGTQSLSAPTEWAPLADCSWTEDGLITPAAAEILRQQRSPTVSAPSASGGGERRSVSVPGSVTRFVLGLEAAQRAGTVDHVRQLCDGSGPFLESLDAASRAVAEDTLSEARSWLAGHEDYQQRVFADLAQAVSEKRAFDVRSQVRIAETLTRRAASPAEEEILAAARAFLRPRNNLPSEAPVPPRRILEPSPRRWRHAAQERPKATKAVPASRQGDPGSRRDRLRRRDAATHARGLLSQLQQGWLAEAEELGLITELASAVQAAADELSSGERKKARGWTRRLTSRAKSPRNQPANRSSRRETERPARRELAPHVLESAAAAVRGALKKTARERRTTSWDRLEEQLGSALPRMEPADRVRVLSLVDQSTPSDQPLLSALVAAGDSSMMASYRTVATELGLDVPQDDDDLRDVLQADVEQAYQHWRYH